MTRTLVATAVILAAVGGLLGAVLGRDPGAGGLDGALLGLAVALAVGVHLLVRSAAGRGVEASSPEAAEDSVERRVWVAASSATFVDAVSVLVLVALLGLWAEGPLLRWLPLAGLAVVLADLGVRVRRGWRRQVGDGA
ncbi:hypothetical protein [Isoptericola cucumis]|uniref:hypothetical protein n=1 Tax=Isoptericola cucumis TaxID=1776856 RepID=UPI0016640CF4|nr:hypothetical protein [Isoptericola cucumis]